MKQEKKVNASPSSTSVKTYIVNGLDCANCAAKMERKIQALPGIDSATLTFATKQLTIVAEEQDALFRSIAEACTFVEPDVTLTPKEEISTVKEEHNDQKKDLISFVLGAVLFIMGLLTQSQFPTVSIILFVLAYLVLGLEIVLTAVRNLFKGNIFDENFLMSIATIGALAIKQYPEAVGVMLFYRIGEWFEHKAVAKSRSQIMDALDLRPETVNLVQGKDILTISVDVAKVDDILLVRPGDRIPLDGVVIDGESRIDTSPITGEPVPVTVKPGSQVISGCMNAQGALQIKVQKILSESMVTRILNSVENAAASKPSLERYITRFSRVYTPFVVLLAILTAVIPSLITGEWSKWVYSALTFLVISCPCALVLSVPLAFFSGIGAGSKQGILFKSGIALEALLNIKAIVMDKTGTITKGIFQVQKVISLYPEQYSEDMLLGMAASCETASTHPIANSICEAALQKSIPFTSTGSITEISGKGIIWKEKEDIILCGNRKLMEEQQIATNQFLPSQYGTEVLIAKNNTLIGYLVIADTIKPEAKEAIHSLKKQGLITAMLSGDTRENAEAVGKETGIDEVHARLLPDDKLQKLKEIRKRYGAVMFVGDGINDGPVLAGADVGAAMGSGADAAIEAADVVFMHSELDAIPASIRIAKSTGRIARQNVTFALTVKLLIMIPGLVGLSSMWLAVFADTGVAMLCILNSIRLLYKK
ncbi:MAG TPA: heavy metal translocating P-type ATPase [Lachnospiraceae bacterium]|nr:heavy metal translocating P-type ATPase [Lachnospiraceae bacterium]